MSSVLLQFLAPKPKKTQVITYFVLINMWYPCLFARSVINPKVMNCTFKNTSILFYDGNVNVKQPLREPQYPMEVHSGNDMGLYDTLKENILPFYQKYII